MTDSNEKLSRKLCDDLLNDGLLIYCPKIIEATTSTNATESNTSKLKNALLRQFSLTPRKIGMTQYSFKNNRRERIQSSSSLDDNVIHYFKLCTPLFQSDDSKVSVPNADPTTDTNTMTEFSIHLEETQFLFKAISPDENDKWVQKCYETIELIWMQYCKGITLHILILLLLLMLQLI